MRHGFRFRRKILIPSALDYSVAKGSVTHFSKTHFNKEKALQPLPNCELMMASNPSIQWAYQRVLQDMYRGSRRSTSKQNCLRLCAITRNASNKAAPRPTVASKQNTLVQRKVQHPSQIPSSMAPSSSPTSKAKGVYAPYIRISIGVVLVGSMVYSMVLDPAFLFGAFI